MNALGVRWVTVEVKCPLCGEYFNAYTEAPTLPSVKVQCPVCGNIDEMLITWRSKGRPMRNYPFISEYEEDEIERKVHTDLPGSRRTKAGRKAMREIAPIYFDEYCENNWAPESEKEE